MDFLSGEWKTSRPMTIVGALEKGISEIVQGTPWALAAICKKSLKIMDFKFFPLLIVSARIICEEIGNCLIKKRFISS